MAWRLAAAVAITSTLYLAFLLGSLLTLVVPPLRRRWRNAVYRLWARLGARLIGARVRYEGEPPRAPFFLVSNHLSYVDILLLASRLDVYFIAKAEVRGWPGLGPLSRSIGTLFIDRSARRDVVRVNRAVQRTLERGYGVVLFAEGTSTSGAAVARFKPSLLAYPASRELPVATAAITYRTPPGAPPAHRVVCWGDDSSFGAHAARLLRLPGFEARVVFGPSIADPDRKRLAAALHRQVTELFEPVPGAAADRAAAPAQAAAAP